MPTFRVTGGVLSVADQGSNYPDNTLPGAPPVIDNTLPIPPAPPGIWPPPSLGNPIVPIGPDNTLPVQPGTIWPSPGRPDNSLPPFQGGPDNTLPQPPGEIHNPIVERTFWMLAYCPSLGWKYVSVDPSLRPGNALPPTAEPRRTPAPR